MRTATDAALGFVDWFRPGEFQRAALSLSRLQRLGARHLRTHLSWAEFHTATGADWYDWLIPALARQAELLPCIHYTPPSLSETGRANGPPRRLRDFADFVDQAISAYGRHFDSIELWNEPNNLLDWDWRVDADWVKFCEMVGDAAYWARHRGKQVVLGAPCPTDLKWLRMVGDRGVLDHVDVVGVHGFPGTWESEHGTWSGWDDLLHGVAEVARAYNPRVRLWITEAGYSTWRCDEAGQVRRFLDALSAPAERVYWYGLQDIAPAIAIQEGRGFDKRHYHFGAYDYEGGEKLLGRLLRGGGTEAARRVVAMHAPAVVGRRPTVVTGGAGFIGSNLCDRLAREGEDVLVLDSLARPGVERNLAWLQARHPARVSAALVDVRDEAAVADSVADAASVFHLAAQVAVTHSLDRPWQDMEVNLRGTLGLLEALRRRGAAVPIVFASTNKVYGDLGGVGLERRGDVYRPTDAALCRHGVAEDAPLALHTPYGCSKGAADQYVLDYARSYGVPSAVLRMSCIYGPRQLGTEDQGWVAHFLLRALRGETVAIYGDGCQVRDILYVDDAVAAYVAARRRIGEIAGRAFNLGGGPRNAVSLRQVIAAIERLTGRTVDLTSGPWRAGDQRWYVSDTRRARAALGLAAPLPWRQGLVRLARSLSDALSDGGEPEPAMRRPARRRAPAPMEAGA